MQLTTPPIGVTAKKVVPPWEAALNARGAALNAQYGLPKKAAPGATAGSTAGVTSPSAPVVPGWTPPTMHVTIPGYDPDYASLIKADPTLLEGEADLSFYGDQYDAAKRDAIRRAVIAAGLAPAGGATGDIDEGTLAAAQANHFSSAADLATQRQRGQTDLEAVLAARGILDSGGLAGGSDRNQTNYERGTTQLTSSLLDQIANYTNDATGKKANLAQQRAQLREAAALRIQQDPRYQPIGSSSADYDAATGYYRTADGRYYDANGNRIDSPSPINAPGGTPAPSSDGSTAMTAPTFQTVNDYTPEGNYRPNMGIGAKIALDDALNLYG